MTRRSVIDVAAVVVIGAVSLFALPKVLELYVIMNLTSYLSMAVFALSLALVWGYGGIASYGQAAFFGLAAYSYAIAGINFGDTTPGVLIALVLPMLFATMVGWLIFYGRLTPVFVSVVTLCVCLVLFKFISSTAGHGYKIGKAALGGFNGIPNTPVLNMPGDPTAMLSPDALFGTALVCLVASYAFCKWLIQTRFGRTVIAVRENEVRAELLGYDARAIKLGIFVISAGISALGGILFANSVYVSPNVFGLATMAQSLIWVVVGGLGTLLGPVAACMVLAWLTGELGTDAFLNPNIVLGLILIVFVRFVPNGLLPSLIQLWQHLRPSRRVAIDSNEAPAAQLAGQKR